MKNQHITKEKNRELPRTPSNTSRKPKKEERGYCSIQDEKNSLFLRHFQNYNPKKQSITV